MYQDFGRAPMIMAGPGIPAGQVCHEPVTLVDGSHHPRLRAPRHPDDADLPGTPRPRGAG